MFQFPHTTGDRSTLTAKLSNDLVDLLEDIWCVVNNNRVRLGFTKKSPPWAEEGTEVSFEHSSAETLYSKNLHLETTGVGDVVVYV